ncbi:hypothetical protein ATCR1_24065 [Agrobacterium tumefaciens CCNWGS0286]|uniref:VOC family protein n=1 Tax=Agrobacterium tumefaciens TaxID=358 RepID=UPI00023346AB|nr:VOC family protein [Agrobacterium tumefaciens]EHH02586.1 hypothetical protein ATCR1_24065 [Agrobacterium tumefaciens CCNWGS0286]
MSLPNAIEVVTLFVDDVSETKAFYLSILEPEVIYEDTVSCVLGLDGVMINLLHVSQAPELMRPARVAQPKLGVSVLLTIRVSDVNSVCASLEAKGVSLLNGPIDRPWGRRTAAFADPSGHVWEIAEILG